MKEMFYEYLLYLNKRWKVGFFYFENRNIKFVKFKFLFVNLMFFIVLCLDGMKVFLLIVWKLVKFFMVFRFYINDFKNMK